MSTIKHARAHHDILTLSLNNFQGPGPTSLIGWLPERVCARRRKNRKRVWKDIVFASFFKSTRKGGHRECHRRQVQTCSAGWELLTYRSSRHKIVNSTRQNQQLTSQSWGARYWLIRYTTIENDGCSVQRISSRQSYLSMTDDFWYVSMNRNSKMHHDDTRDHGGGFMQSAHAGFTIIPSR